VRVLCCFTDLYDATQAALAKYAPDAELVDVSGDDYAYWKAICAAWTGEDDLLIVEQDIEIHKTVIPQMAACPEPWCTFPYRLWRPDAWCYNALGCTKFSAGLQRDVSPAEIEQVQARWLVPNASHPGAMTYSPEVMAEGMLCECGRQGSPPCWRHIDFKIADTLEGRGPGQRDPIGAHVHQPAVCHLPIDKPVNEAAARVTGFPWQMPEGVRPIEFPVIEPARTYHSASLDDRPDWWPKREPGVIVTVKNSDTGRVLTVADALDPELTDTEAAFLFAGTDKVSALTGHGYFRAYQRIALETGPAGRVCEVGVYRGASLKMWQALFPAGLVAGVDNAPYAAWPPGTVQVVAEQDDPGLPALLTEVSPDGFDLIVDDASHDGKLTRRTWELLWPLVRPGGYYVIEDWSEGTMAALAWKPGAVESMLHMAESFLPLLALRGCDPDSIEYRYGLIIMHRRDRG